MKHSPVSLESAVERLLERISVPERHETAPLLDALGRIAFKTLEALIDTPPFDNAPVDGFALRHTDLTGASKDSPVALRVVETFYAGDTPAKALEPGQCARVMTGAPIPPGATCVVRYEDTDNGKDYVKVPFSLKEYQNYRFQGEELRKGRKLLEKGEYITVPHIGILAGQGYTEAAVFTRPKVGILSTGSELISGNQPLRPGKIYDSNRYMLGAKVKRLGAEPVFGANAADDPKVIAETLTELLETCDFIVTTGGVSVGDQDYMPLVGDLLKAERMFRGIRMKPGGWVTGLYLASKIILCLSGNPGAAAVSFDLLAGPGIRRLAGAALEGHRRIRCSLEEPFSKPNKSRRFLYAYLEAGKVSVSSTGVGSGHLASSLGSNCIVDIPAGAALSAGDTVEALLIEP
ncbi:MAG: molybdopterin molybdotransferase MoeA [Treponema sp.]|jgi:molybdopterin molybdotransferase|nr:molybdopterin molybdotransferase MoeA [Treponema sp.]